MTDYKTPGQGTEAHSVGEGSSGSRILRGVERFRTPLTVPARSTAAGNTSRVRRSVVGHQETGDDLPPTIDPVQTVCAHCGQTFVVVLRPGMKQVPCIHCSHLNTVVTDRS